MDSTIIIACIKVLEGVSQSFENMNNFKTACRYGMEMEDAINRGNIIAAQKYSACFKEYSIKCKTIIEKNKALLLYYMACCYYVEQNYDDARCKLLELENLSSILYPNKIREIQGKGTRILNKIISKERETKMICDRRQKHKQIFIWGSLIFVFLICVLYIINVLK